VIKRVWPVAFLGLTAVLIGAEVWAANDGNPGTVPWTDYLVRLVPAEVAFALVGALILWLPIHLWIRYARKRKAEKRGI
jgi:hypothetical protein